MPRLFTAINITGPLYDELQRICPLDRSIVSQPDLHLTLQFIGDVSVEDAKNIEQKLESIKQKKFTLNLSGVESFDKGRLPHFLVVDAKKEIELIKLHSRVGKTLSELNINLDRRPFKPHITICKLNEKNEAIVECFKKENSDFTYTSEISEFSLYEVDNSAKNPRYIIKRNYSLK